MVLMPMFPCKDIDMKHVGLAVLTARASPVSLTVLPNFDLSRAIARVAKEHPDWTAERLERAEADYRIFLATAKQNPKGNRPSKDVDEVWHAHILHTKAYVTDCAAYFGHYFHHEPDERPKTRVHAGDCQGGGDGCTACGSGCSGGGTIRAAADCGDACEGSSCLGHD